MGHGGHTNLGQEIEALKRDKQVLMQEVIRLRHQQQVRGWADPSPASLSPAWGSAAEVKLGCQLVFYSADPPSLPST